MPERLVVSVLCSPQLKGISRREAIIKLFDVSARWLKEPTEVLWQGVSRDASRTMTWADSEELIGRGLTADEIVTVYESRNYPKEERNSISITDEVDITVLGIAIARRQVAGVGIASVEDWILELYELGRQYGTTIAIVGGFELVLDITGRTVTSVIEEAVGPLCGATWICASNEVLPAQHPGFAISRHAASAQLLRHEDAVERVHSSL